MRRKKEFKYHPSCALKEAMIFFSSFHSNSDGKFHLTMTITLEFNDDDHDGLEMEMSEKDLQGCQIKVNRVSCLNK